MKEKKKVGEKKKREVKVERGKKKRVEKVWNLKEKNKKECRKGCKKSQM